MAMNMKILTVFAFLLVATVPSVHGALTCQKGWKLYYQGGTCIRQVEDAKTWQQSRDECQKLGGDLVRQDSDAKTKFLEGINEVHNMQVWIGLHLTSDGKWKWLDDKTQTRYTHWHSSEPNFLNTEKCATTIGWNTYWNNYVCSKKLSYICETKALNTVPLICPYGWELNGHTCYGLFKTSKTWNEARSSCLGVKGHLVTISDASTQDFIYKRFIKSNPYKVWIGLNDIKQEGNYAWVDSNAVYSYKNWKPKQPNNYNNQDCVRVFRDNYGQWEDDICSFPFQYICQKQATGGDFVCPARWKIHGKTCYRLYQIQKSWDDSRAYCKREKGHLVSIPDKDTNTFLKNQVYKNHSSNIWIGLHNVKGKSQWADVTLKVSFTDWTRGEPSGGWSSYYGGSQKCVLTWQIHNFLWDNQECFRKYHFICQKDSTPGASDFNCEEGWDFNLDYKICIKSFQVKQDWKGAKASCELKGGALLKIPDATFNQYIKDRIGTIKTGYWIGLKENSATHKFYWDGETTKPKYDNHLVQGSTKSPNKQRCGSISTTKSKWDVKDCTRQNFFFCQKNPYDAVSCPAGYTVYKKGATCIKLVKTPADWESARKNCQKDGGDLIKILNDNTNKFVLGLISRRVYQYWIGLSDRAKENSYRWLDDTADAKFTYWDNRMKVRKDTKSVLNCIETNGRRDSRWMQKYCSYRRRYICQHAATIKGKKPVIKEPTLVCPTGWTMYKPGKTCIKLSEDIQTWSSARKICQQLGGDIIKITDSGFNQYVNNVLLIKGMKAEPYIGLNDITKEGHFRWLDEWHDTKYSNWYPGEPSGGKEDCTVIIVDKKYNFKWNDVPCNNRKAYICQQGALPPGSRNCGPDWYESPYSDYCYRVNTESLSWFDAKSSCQVNGGDLVSIVNHNEMLYLTGWVRNVDAKTFWTGANRIYRSGWNWHDRAPFAYLNWDFGQPSSNKSEACVMMNKNGGSWNVQPCAKRMPSLCKKHGKVINHPTPKPTKPTIYVPSGKVWGCPNGWDGYRGSCYYMYRSATDIDFYKAKAICNKKSSNLAAITDYSENQFIFGRLISGRYSCADGWTRYGAICYRLYQTQKSWNAARDFCLSQSAILATIINVNVQKFINKQFVSKDKSNIWLGMNDRNVENHFEWVDTTRNIIYKNFARGQPNNLNNQDCVHIWNTLGFGQWADSACTNKYHFLCQQSAANRVFSCPSGWKVGAPYCFKLFTYKRTWKDAKKSCNLQKGHLAIIQNKGYNQFLQNNLYRQVPNDDIWIGLNDLKKKRSFVWGDSTFGGKYRNWGPNQPTNYIDQNCVHRWGRQGDKWANSKCNEKKNYICQRSAIYAFEHAWIGLNDFKRKSSFTWSDGITPVTFTNWRPGNPVIVQSKKTCSLMLASRGRWISHSCDTRLRHVVCKQNKKIIDKSSYQPFKGCSQGGIGYNDKCYIILSTQKTFYAASTQCKGHGGNLATINDRYTQAFITAELYNKDGNGFWIGLSNQKSVYYNGVGWKYPYKWASGANVSFTNWDRSHTGIEKYTCVGMKMTRPAGLWHSYKCTETLGFICEYQRPGFTSPKPVVVSTPLLPCPSGWTGIGHMCYKLYATYNNKLSWPEAKSACQKLISGSTLASVTSKGLSDALKKNVLHVRYFYNDAWIGLNDRDREGGYKWADGQPFVFQQWARGEPNDLKNRQDCVLWQSRQNKWTDVSCYNSHSYICQAPRGARAYVIPSGPTVGTTVAPGTKCGKGSWTIFNGNCYLLTETYQTWFHARASCRSRGAELVSIANNDENDYVATLINKGMYKNYWIGFNDFDGDVYKWSDGTPARFFSWLPQEPNDAAGGERCAEIMRNGGWNDYPCYRDRPSVCKKRVGSSGIITAAPTTAPPVGGCPPKFQGIPGTSHCYYVAGLKNGESKSFWNARGACKTIFPKSRLASIHTDIDEEFITTLIAGLKTPVWIGLVYQQYHGYYRSSGNKYWSDNTQIDYVHWGRHQPRSSFSEKCVTMMTNSKDAGGWANGDCSSQYPFICASKKDKIYAQSQPKTTGCKQGYQRYRDSCYKFVSTKQNWKQSETTCAQDGGHLACIQNRFEIAQLELMIHANSKSQIWIGLSNKDVLNSFTWTDGWPVLYTKWGKQQPELNTSKECVYQDVGFGWYTADCQLQLSSICEINLDPKPLPTSVPGKCPSGWLRYGGYCYYLKSDTTVSWPNANYICENTLDSQLASIHSSSEAKFVSMILEQDKIDAWIGLHSTRNNAFTWSDQSEVEFVGWAPGSPLVTNDTRHQACVLVQGYNGNWTDTSCFSKHAFLCKVKQTPTVTTTIQPPNTVQPKTKPAVVTRFPKNRTPVTKPKVVTQNPVKTAAPVTRKPGGFSIRVNPTSSYTPQPKGPSYQKVHKEQSQGLKSGGIAGVVIGTVVFVAIIATVLIFLKRRHTTTNSESPDASSGFENAMYDATGDASSVNFSGGNSHT